MRSGKRMRSVTRKALQMLKEVSKEADKSEVRKKDEVRIQESTTNARGSIQGGKQE